MNLKNIFVYIFLLALTGCGLGESKSGGTVRPPAGDDGGRKPCATCGSGTELAMERMDPVAGNGGENVILYGSGFTEDTLEVYFGPNKATILVQTNEEVTAIVPASSEPGPVTIRLVRADGVGKEYPNAFEYKSARDCSNGPEISYLTPGSASKLEAVAVHGRGFVVGDNDATSSIFSIANSNAITISRSASLFTLFPPNLDEACKASQCIFDVTVSNPDGCSFTLEDAFTYSREFDTDEDGLNDFEEEDCKSDPTTPHSDEDSLTDWEECVIHKTNPKNPDSDEDTIWDDDEVEKGSNPNNNDSDCDGTLDQNEANDFWLTHTVKNMNINSNQESVSNWQSIHNTPNLGAPASEPDFEHDQFGPVYWCRNAGIYSDSSCNVSGFAHSYFRTVADIPEIPEAARDIRVQRMDIHLSDFHGYPNPIHWRIANFYINGQNLPKKEYCSRYHHQNQDECIRYNTSWNLSHYDDDIELRLERGGQIGVGLDYQAGDGWEYILLNMDITIRYRLSIDTCE